MIQEGSVRKAKTDQGEGDSGGQVAGWEVEGVVANIELTVVAAADAWFPTPAILALAVYS